MLKIFLQTFISVFVISLVLIAIVQPALFSNTFQAIKLMTNGNDSAYESSIPNETLKANPQVAGLFIQQKINEEQNNTELTQNLHFKALEIIIKDALAYSAYEQREVLKDVIEKYNSEFKALTKDIKKIKGDKRKENIEASLSIIDRHIFIWSPYYYYVHSEAQAPILKTAGELKEKRGELIKELAEIDGGSAGKIATEYLQFLVNDISKSGRRKNSDFVQFSYLEYQAYRKMFDELWQKYPDFRKGFAKNFVILLDSFYVMHSDVDPSHNKDVRARLSEMRQELIKTHIEALKELDKTEQDVILQNIVNTLNEQERLRQSAHLEIREFIKTDTELYKSTFISN